MIDLFGILLGILSIVIGYFLGGILPAFIFGQVKSIDIRDRFFIKKKNK